MQMPGVTLRAPRGIRKCWPRRTAGCVGSATTTRIGIPGGRMREMSRMTHPGPHALIHLRVQPFNGDGELERGLRAAGWKIRSADDAGTIARLPSHEVPAVGLLDLRGVDDAGAQALFAQPALVPMLADQRQ